MKLFNFLLLKAILILIYFSSNTRSVNISKRFEKRYKSDLNTDLDSSNDKKESLHAGKQTTPSTPATPEERRILTTALYRMRAMVAASNQLITNIYFTNIKVVPGGTSKVIYAITVKGFNGNLGSDSQRNPLIKVCVPSDPGAKSYLTYNCIFSDCEKTYEEAIKCKNVGKNIPIDTPKYSYS